jgi:ribosomal protein L16 Arg81 hydroxylase
MDMSTDKHSLLPQLLAPASVREFLDQYWPHRYFAAHGDFARLPPALRAPELTDFRALAERYAGWVTFGKGTLGPRTLSTRGMNPVQLYEMGLTVHLAEIERCVPALESLLRQLERELGLPAGCTRASLFASPQADGVSCHFDSEDVFSIQLRGHKRFHVAPVTEIRHPFGMQFGPRMRVFDDLFPQAAGGFPRPEQVEFETVDMRPGSVLFMPRGTWHRTDADSDSYAVSLILRPPSAMECVLRELKDQLMQDSDWRRPLYGAWGDGAARAAALDSARRLLERLPEVVRGLRAEDLVFRSPPEQLQQIGRATRFQRMPDARLTITPGIGKHVLKVSIWDSDRGEVHTLETEVPSPYVPTLTWLGESSAAFAAGDVAQRFPSLALADHLKLLDLLTRAQFLKLLWFRPRATAS